MLSAPAGTTCVPVPRPTSVTEVQTSSAQVLLERLRANSLILTDDWEALPPQTREDILSCADPKAVLAALTQHGLLTEYQAARVEAGTTFGLILGNYRVLDRLGSGAMGIVFKAEHRRLRRLVAIKVLPVARHQDPRLLLRFFTEMRAVAYLHHPHIVSALDAGEIAQPGPDEPILHYLVMEYVPGQDLEAHVQDKGPLPMARACDLIYQVASALGEAHKHNLVHRDIKPSNILVTPEGQGKLLDFGLVHDFRNHGLTQPGTLLGTIDYVAPEQVRDASAVDIRADIYGLGGTLFWCLSGRTPFETRGTIAEELARRWTQPPPSVRTWRPEIPPELDAVLVRMLAVNPDDRYPTPQAVMRALFPFQQVSAGPNLMVVPASGNSGQRLLVAEAGPGIPRKHQVLLVDDEAMTRTMCRYVLEAEGILCDEAADGLQALEAIRAKAYDLLLLDIDMPRLAGTEVLRQLRENPPCPHLKIIMASGRATADEMAQMLLNGADDYLSKPISVVQLQARLKAALHLKEAQDRSDVLNRQLGTVIAELEGNLSARDSEVLHVRNALVLALAKLLEHRNNETGAHLLRLQRYCRCLAEEAANLPVFAGQLDPTVIQMVEYSVPLHDIGHAALPDHILMKPGKLDADERIIMQNHTVIGAETLKKVAQRHGPALAFLHTAVDIARHHHERYDGAGYPDRLAGNGIALAARIATVGDVYDALRSRRSYRPAFGHAAAVQLMTEGPGGQFDPHLLQAFRRCAGQFERIFRDLPDWTDV